MTPPEIQQKLTLVFRDVFDNPPPADLAVLFHDLSLQGRLAGFQVHERFYEIGSPAGLRDFEEYLLTCQTAHLSR